MAEQLLRASQAVRPTSKHKITRPDPPPPLQRMMGVVREAAGAAREEVGNPSRGGEAELAAAAEEGQEGQE
ncbi:hypothetical protein HK104_004803 [Borealophlyctis nickersoniae]|nr:hypothetical protein HK104_004803 [Borealophlyctis nickersoniae]